MRLTKLAFPLALAVFVWHLSACYDWPTGPRCTRPITGCDFPTVGVYDSVVMPSSFTRSVHEGAWVDWHWRGSMDHNVTFEDGRSSSGTKSSGRHERTFTRPGTYRYRCTIHSTDFASGMVGEVIVLQ